MSSLGTKLGSVALKGMGQKSALAVPASRIHLSAPVAAERITCTLIPGDGVGPEMMDSARNVMQSMGVPIDFEEKYFSEVNHRNSCSLDDVMESINRNKVCLKGTITVPEAGFSGDLMGLNTSFRKELDLYANVVKVRSLPGVKSRHANIDTVIIREQTEGEYSCIEHESVPGVVECLKVVTATKSYRIAKFAFDYATRHGRKKVTCVHKANIMKLGDGLFQIGRASCRERV